MQPTGKRLMRGCHSGEGLQRFDVMVPEFIEDRAALFVSGALNGPERESFELMLDCDAGLRSLVAGLSNTLGACALAGALEIPPPSADLKARILASVSRTPIERVEPEAVVVADAEGLVTWANPAFTAMCGFTLSELQGRKPGVLLQGAETDRAAVARIRAGLREGRPCRETLVNYHKDGSRYVVDVRITPILDEQLRPLWFIAKERKLPVDRVAMVSG